MRVIIWISLILAVVIAAVLGWWWYANPASETASSSLAGPIALTQESQKTPVPMEAAPEKTSSSPSSGAVKGATPALAVRDESRASLPGATPARVDDFSQYEKYKDDPASLFAELRLGEGTATAATSTVVLNYRGWLTSGKQFDESYSGGKPFTFVMGKNEVIPGFEQAVMGMKVGGKRRLIVPPAVGYGAQEISGIPPNSVLVFDVELLEIR